MTKVCNWITVALGCLYLCALGRHLMGVVRRWRRRRSDRRQAEALAERLRNYGEPRQEPPTRHTGAVHVDLIAKTDSLTRGLEKARAAFAGLGVRGLDGRVFATCAECESPFIPEEEHHAYCAACVSSARAELQRGGCQSCRNEGCPDCNPERAKANGGTDG